MKKKIKNELGDEPIGELTVIPDFLPPPEKLVLKERTAKVTLALDQLTIDFFKDNALKTGSKYQRMMREVLKGYALKYGG